MPIGALWTASAYWRPRAGRPYAFAIAALIAASMVGGVLSLAALAFSGYSLGHAIRNAAPLIADIERYRAERGRYPPSLLSVWKDYSPSVIGIDKYQYAPAATATTCSSKYFWFD